MISIKVNNVVVQVNAGISILEACSTIGVKVPRFCYHETLSIAGNCRMCLVEVEGVEKPVASCLTEVSENIVIYTDSLFVKKARENVVEALLLNHPLDCPICDQAGECDLQDQTKVFGSVNSKFSLKRRSVEDKNCGPLIKTIMTRCIHCTRCVRYGAEVAGIDYLGTFNRGTSTEIGSFVANFFDSEISGNVIDLCPVGALTAKPFAYKVRPWELRINESIDITDSTGANIYINSKGNDIIRILPKNNTNINDQIISDKARFSYDSNNSHNRLRSIFNFEKSLNKFRLINWSTFFKKIDDDKISTNSNIIINEDIGFDNINLLSQIKRSQKEIKLSAVRNNKETTNLYFWGLNDKINAIDNVDSIGLIFSLNPKIECSVINARIRTRMQNSLLSLVSLNQHFSSNVKIQFMNLSLVKSLRVVEGKYCNNSKNFVAAECPLVLVSDFLNRRNLSLINLTCFLKRTFENAKIIKVNETSNSESLSYFNIKNVFRKNINLISNTLCINLDDNYDSRRKFFNIKNIYWFNSYSSKLEQQSKVVVPILSEFEEDRVFLNLEQRPQRVKRAFNSFFDARNLNSVLISIFENFSFKDFNSKVSKHWEFLNEIIGSFWLFDKIQRVYSTMHFKTINLWVDQLSKYPTKSNLEDFYCSTKATKNSLNMLQSSRLIRTRKLNF